MARKLNIVKIVLCVMALAVVVGCRGDKAGKNPGEDDWITQGAPMDDGSVLADPYDLTAHGRLVTDFQAQSVLFGFDSTHIAPGELAKLDAVAEYMRRRDKSRVVAVIEGHCDERGSGEYNMALGERRALAAHAYLVSAGVSPDRLTTRSLGEEDPVDPGHTEAAWRLNRRAEFELYQP